MIVAGFVVLVLAGLAFGYRLLKGPTLADRAIGVEGLLVVGVSAIALRTIQTGSGAFIPVVVVAALVGFVSTTVIARFIEEQGG